MIALDSNDLEQIALRVDTQLPGFKRAFDADTSKVDGPLERGTLLDVLQGAATIATLAAALKAMTPSINLLLKDVAPDKSPQEIIADLTKNFHEQFVVPAKEQGGKIKIVANAILAHLASKLSNLE